MQSFPFQHATVKGSHVELSDMHLGVSRGDSGAPLFLMLTKGKQTVEYWVEQIPSDFGIAVRFTKTFYHGGESYDVLLDGASGVHACECMGHLRHHTACKHILAAIELVSVGQIGQLPRKRPAPSPAAVVIEFDDP